MRGDPFRGIRRTMHATIIEPYTPDEIVRLREAARQVEAERQIADEKRRRAQAARLEHLGRARYEVATWQVTPRDANQYEDVRDWIDATLAYGPPIVCATFEGFYAALYNRKAEQLGETPRSYTATLLRAAADEAWARLTRSHTRTTECTPA